MNRNRLWAFLVVCFVIIPLFAQDALPSIPGSTPANKRAKPIRDRSTLSDTVSVPVVMPVTFAGVGHNVITDSMHLLSPVLERLRLVKEHISKDSVRIVHIGDSHVRGHIYPQTTGGRLRETFGSVFYTDMGVNGATCLTFTHSNRIADIVALKPELLILSFGTNESHNRRYLAGAHYQQMKELITLLRDRLPTVPILLTTPPGSYESFRQRRHRRTYTINPRTAAAVGVIRTFAADHQLVVWDMYNIIGGKNQACKNWQKARMMRPDHVHYTPEGYALQGELLYTALIKAYNDYVSH